MSHIASLWTEGVGVIRGENGVPEPLLLEAHISSCHVMLCRAFASCDALHV